MSQRFIVSSFLYLLSFVFMVVALQALLIPNVFVTPMEIQIESAASFAEIRAGYSGCFGGLALLFFMGARNEELNALCLRVAAVVLGLFALGRLISLFAEGVPNHFSMIVHAAEFCAFSFSVILISRIKSES